MVYWRGREPGARGASSERDSPPVLWQGSHAWIKQPALYANDGHAGNFLNHDWDVVATRTAIAAVVGGTASQLSGGAFANGAVTSHAAFV